VEKLLPWNVDIEQLKQSFGAVNRVLCWALTVWLAGRLRSFSSQ